MIKENENPVKRARKPGECSSPLAEMAYSPPVVLEAAQFASDNDSTFLKFRRRQIEKLERRAARCGRASEGRRNSLAQDQRKLHPWHTFWMRGKWAGWRG